MIFPIISHGEICFQESPTDKETGTTRQTPVLGSFEQGLQVGQEDVILNLKIYRIIYTEKKNLQS